MPRGVCRWTGRAGPLFQGWATSLVSRGVLLCQPSTCSREGARDKLVLLIETSTCPHSSATLPSPIFSPAGLLECPAQPLVTGTSPGHPTPRPLPLPSAGALNCRAGAETQLACCLRRRPEPEAAAREEAGRVSENLVQSPGFLVLSAPLGGTLLSGCRPGRKCPGERTRPVPVLPALCLPCPGPLPTGFPLPSYPR